ncbi:hypothetical protein VOLCADRAFT_104069 [Volvox carteri f. nagariensis]|uniref:SET domain-containing protein n=1 Tax=Volvox carteri f. nagariensis TaxID=3068 RepID=D8TR12_VOLCA|nr:uncharacterized protein VOLCADRAFT_104069 [Volvox carteri f. nagariensis]EFJ50256.1 hypothetical protein VOLCADRAFT_104069 [Volvox carteri f. nagariensis]|eukprot:XP_002948876.1 hypothetical protein VOLCADRAFT_104069 [Volvox carteri f. nagariensis]
MATPPLALVTSSQRQRPSGELVVDEILERKLYASKWFSVLYDGSSRSCNAQFQLAPCDSTSIFSNATAPGSEGTDAPRAEQPPEPVLASTLSLTKAGPAAAVPPAKKKGFLASRSPTARRGKSSQASAAAAVAAAAAGDSGAAAAEALPMPDRREQTRLAKVVKFNCFGDDAEDLAACECRGEQPRGHIGLWPEFALLNHSCAPNTTNFVIGGSMVVRACRRIKAGEELLPFNRRIGILSEDYGFECSCERCRAEQAHYEKVEDVYMELFEAVNDKLGPAFLEGRAVGDMEAVGDVQREVQSWLRRLYGLFRKTLLAPDVRQYIIASMYDAYDLLFSCAAALGQGEDASSLQASLKAIEAVSAGSDLHVLLAVRHYDCTVKEHGDGSGLAGLARETLRRAHVARYGPVSEEMISRLIDLNRKLHVES